MPNRTGSLRVHPFLGFIRNPIDAAEVRFNPDEVSSVFTLPIEYLIRPDVRETRVFRNTKHSYTVFKVPDHIEGEREIWGLTSFILDGKDISTHPLLPSNLSYASALIMCLPSL